MKKRHAGTLIIGSGAAGLAAAVRLHDLGVSDILVCTEGLRMGTSINTGSDKQTYYKLGMYGAEADSPELMARDMMSGGAMHGDLALVEAALSPRAFAGLAELGVPFPCDTFGQYIGYKTDHDPKRRATSCGPYTSREMCRALIDALKKRNIPVTEKCVAVHLLMQNKICRGAVFVNTAAETPEKSLEAVIADYTVFAVGGPGGLYAESVYPNCHTGAIGIALAAGAKARNLPESQFGIASKPFRWNLSGSYMQVLPRFYSVDEQGREHDFLAEKFDPQTMCSLIFRKGFQWPFCAANESSQIDLAVFREIHERGRRVFLDYLHNPVEDFDLKLLDAEAREYLVNSKSTGKTPLERLKQMNAPAYELYREHGTNLAEKPLEIAVCAQHNNGGLAADINSESENIRNLFPIGEVNGSHGVTRPGGTALNAGQCQAIRAAETIAARKPQKLPPVKLPSIKEFTGGAIPRDWRAERTAIQQRMSYAGGFLREKQNVRGALADAKNQWRYIHEAGRLADSARVLAELLRNESLLFAQICYLSAILKQIESGVGSRGGAAVLVNGSFLPEDKAYRDQVLETQSIGKNIQSYWKPVRPLPASNGWFETVWADYRKRKGIK